MQQMYYNAYWSEHGTKVQYGFQRDLSPEKSWFNSGSKPDMLLKLSANVDNNPKTPVECVTVKAYGNTAYLQPSHAETELHLVGL